MNLLIVSPVRWDFAVIKSEYLGSWASSYVKATEFCEGLVSAKSAGFSIFLPKK
jgi:hypothetical protein